MRNIDKITFDSTDWKKVDKESTGDLWKNYAHLAHSKGTKEHLQFITWFRERYSSGIYHPKYVQLFAKAIHLKII
ncbi:hypothetical protein D7X33_31905 [Butyricicoccus sp. 1XD8-22]|nr:hypothetical protein D7X33_31905 [Butyricicoccus sp. 1XD8-22]